MDSYLAASFYKFHVLEKKKLMKTNRLSHVNWLAPREGEILWKTIRRQYYILKKVLNIIVSAVCQRKYDNKQKVLFT